MGYSCPVCEDPQADGAHLANHLAFTAMVRGGDHEEYLDEHVPGWGELSESELAEKVADAAEETEYPQVFEDTTEEGHEHSHDHAHDHEGHEHEHGGHGHPNHDGPGRGHSQRGPGNDPLPSGTSVPEPSAGDETEEILREARELTRKRREGGDNDGEGDSDEGAREDSEDSETE